MISLFVLLSLSIRAAVTLKCYSCASADYRALFERNSLLASTVTVPKFDQFCDNEEGVQAIAPLDTCRSACVTVYEPQFFGGLQSLHRPYTYIRGCAEKVFAAMETRPVEVDVLHQESICVSLQLSQIYPQVQANEVVKVCSCTDNGCNYKTTTLNGCDRWTYWFLPSLCLLLILF